MFKKSFSQKIYCAVWFSLLVHRCFVLPAVWVVKLATWQIRMLSYISCYLSFSCHPNVSSVQTFLCGASQTVSRFILLQCPFRYMGIMTENSYDNSRLIILCIYVRFTNPSVCNNIIVSGGSRIFLRGAPTPKVGVLTYFLAENCMKMQEFGPPGAPLRSATDCYSGQISVGVKVRIQGFAKRGAKTCQTWNCRWLQQ